MCYPAKRLQPPFIIKDFNIRCCNEILKIKCIFDPALICHHCNLVKLPSVLHIKFQISQKSLMTIYFLPEVHKRGLLYRALPFLQKPLKSAFSSIHHQYLN